MLKLHPNCPAIVLRRSLDMRDSGFVRPALHALENLIKDTEAKGQSYYLPFYFLADSYSRCGETKKAEDACLKILKKFPQSVEAARGMLIINRRLHSQKVADESLRQFAYLSEHPPKYDQVILLNDESQNYFKTTIAAMMLDHCNRKVGESHFGKIIKLGDKTILGKSCVELKCQEFGESSYETVALAKDIAIVKPLARTVSLICGAPVSEYLPLSDTLVKDGYPSQRLTVTSIRKVKVTPNMMTLNPKYHQVKNKGELIYASNGDLKDSDLDQFLQSK